MSADEEVKRRLRARRFVGMANPLQLNVRQIIEKPDVGIVLL